MISNLIVLAIVYLIGRHHGASCAESPSQQLQDRVADILGVTEPKEPETT